MKAQDLISLATLAVTLLAATIAFCSLRSQINGLYKQLTLQNFSEYTKRYADIISRFPEDVNDFRFVAEGRPDRNPLMRSMRLYFDLCYEEWQLGQLKMLDQRIWTLWESGMKVAFGKPAFRQAWGVIRETSDYGGEFERFVDQAMVVL